MLLPLCPSLLCCTGGQNLRGTLPTELALLSSLRGIDFTGNQLHGTLPPSLGRVLRLVVLNYNDLTGPIPTEWFTSPYIDNIQLESNAINGTIPTEIGELSTLEGLHVLDNQLSGTIPTEMGNLTKLGESVCCADCAFVAPNSSWHGASPLQPT